MAVAAQLCYTAIGLTNLNSRTRCSGSISSSRKFASFFKNLETMRPRRVQIPLPSIITCSASNKPSPSSEISSAAKIRSEVLSPFRSVRMFFYVAFIASGALGGFIAATRLISALANPSRAAEVPDILTGLGIDIGAVSIFAFLYYRENNAKNAQMARLSREENLSNLKLRVNQNRILPMSAFRGISRLVILAGSASFIEESFKLSEPFTDRLLERGVLVVPFATDGNSPSFEFDESEEVKEMTAKRKGSGSLLLFMSLNGPSIYLYGWMVVFGAVVLVTLLGMLLSYNCHH